MGPKEIIEYCPGKPKKQTKINLCAVCGSTKDLDRTVNTQEMNKLLKREKKHMQKPSTRTITYTQREKRKEEKRKGKKRNRERTYK